jgi:hypothetical protein
VQFSVQEAYIVNSTFQKQVCTNALIDNRSSSEVPDDDIMNNPVNNGLANDVAYADALTDPDNNGSSGEVAHDDGSQEDKDDEPWGCLIPWDSSDNDSDESLLVNDDDNSTDDITGIPVAVANAPDNIDTDHPLGMDTVKQYGILSDPLFVLDLSNLDVNLNDPFGKYQSKYD